MGDSTSGATGFLSKLFLCEAVGSQEVFYVHVCINTLCIYYLQDKNTKGIGMARTSANELDNAGKIIRDRLQELGWTHKEAAKVAGIDPGTGSQIINGTRRHLDKINALLKAIGVSYDYAFLENPGSQLLLTRNPQQKIAGSIRNSDLELIEEWMMDQPEPSRVASNIIFMVESRYKDFEEWVKKRGEPGQHITLPGKQSEG